MATSPTPPAEPPSAPGQHYWLILAIVCFGGLTAQWSMGPIAAILPTLAADLGVSVSAIGWVMNVYFLMLVGTVLVMGRLGDLFGHGRVFSLGVVVVTAAGVACGLAGNLPALLIGRGLQGVGSAMVLGTTLAIIALTVPVASRGRAIGYYSMTTGAATLVGVWVSTWSVQHLSWHWAFFLGVPFGIIGALLGWRLRLPSVDLASRRIDWAGAMLLFATLMAASLALNHLHEGGETFEAGGPYHLAMHALTLVLFAAFIKVEQRAESPLLGFKLLRRTEFSAGVIGNGIAHMNMLATAFLLPFLLERGRGLSPAETGLLFMCQQGAMVVCSLLAGVLYDRVRSPWIGPAGLAGIAVGLLALGALGGELPYPGVVVLGSLLGAGLGGFTTVNNTAIMTLAPREQRGFASGLIETTRHFGHSLGVSVSSNFMGAAVGGAVASALQYIDGFEQASRALGLIAALGVVGLLWPAARNLLPPGGRGRREVLLAPSRPIAGGSD